MTKYARYYQLMTEKNEQLFNDFDVVHAEFVKNQSNIEEFHSKGQKVLDIIRDWERRLCSGMERGQNAQYSSNLAEKFMSLVKKRYSAIDQVGLRQIK